jgi:subtilisin-like proprotein convertase family protein/subtilisin family serine protease
MSDENTTYTYRCGKKITLEKSAEQIVVRALPNNLDAIDVVSSEQVSSASTRININSENLEALMERSRVIGPTHHAYYDSETGSEFLVTDRIFITFSGTLTDQQIDEFSGKYGLVKKVTYNDRDYLFQLTNHTGINPLKLVVKLMEKEPLVELADLDLNQRMTRYQFTVPIDPEYSKQWHLHTSLNHPQYDPRSSSKCEGAWALLDNFGSNGVVVAVADDGCKLDHFDVDSADKFASWAYFEGGRLVTRADIDADPKSMYQTGANHGTACCAVIGAEIDAVMTVGGAPECRLLPIKWESNGPLLDISDSKLRAAIDYIADKVDVMSNSWGSSPRSFWPTIVTNRINELSLTGGRRGKGIVFLWAAGNENCLINHMADEKVPYTNGWKKKIDGSWDWVGVRRTKVFSHNLAELPGVMHIAALASTAKRSHYSNYGPGISLTAPSSNSFEYGPRLTVRGLGITTATGKAVGVRNNFGGTSSATPLVAGIAALTISANPNLSATEVISILKQTASKDLDFTGYPRTPPANYNIDTSWDVSPVAPFNSGHFQDNGDADGSWSPWFGHGRVDAQAAVAEAISRLKVPSNNNFNGNSAPDKSIPDNNDKGIKDKISCDGNFALSSVKVAVEITHTYIGDLQVSIISPSGTSIILHNRSGASKNNLVATFEVNSTPDFHALIGEAVNGDWILQVRDLASIDRGRLKSWSLELEGMDQPSIELEENSAVTIPDNTKNGIERILVVSDTGQLDTIEIELDITHTYIGDLMVKLISPNGISILLHNKSGGSADNIIRSYDMNNTNTLQVLRGQSVLGNWRLIVSDHVNADQGKLNRWAIKLGLMV